MVDAVTQVKNAFQTMNAPSGKSPLEQMEKSAKEFEGYFIGFVFQNAFDSIEKSDLLGGANNIGMYQSMFIDEISKKSSTSGGLGLTNMIMDQYKKNHGISDEGTLPVAASEMAPVAGGEDPSLNLPAPGRLTSGFGLRKDPITGVKKDHDGIDIAMPANTPIRAAASGVVEFSGSQGGYGKTVMLKHEDGFQTLYGHASKLNVKEGAKVKAGDVIAYSGSTGRSTGPHLHFEVREHGEKVDPEKFIKVGNKT